MSEQITKLGAAEQLRLIRAGELRPSELVAASLERVESLHARVNAVVTLAPDAMERARELDEVATRDDAPPLCGLPVGIKDVTPVAGLRQTYGSPLYADHVAQADAVVVERLRAAGAVIVGKTNTPEFATGGNTFNEVFGRTFNPWNLERSAGGSTGGGGAALATGMISLAEGTDLGGSLRIPASFCGVVGLRPSPGLVPTVPSDFLWDTLQVSGPMARRVEDVALALDAMAGPDSRWPTAQPTGRGFAESLAAASVKGCRMAYSPDLAGMGVDDDVERVCREAVFSLRDQGVDVQEVEVDIGWANNAFQVLRGLWMVVQQYPRLDRIDDFGANLKGNVEAGLTRTTTEIAAAEHDRAKLCEQLRQHFEQYDYLVTPSMAVAPFLATENYPQTVGGREMETYLDWLAPTFILSLTGLPVSSVPCGLDNEGLPVGLQVVGPRFGEEAVLALAAAVERQTGGLVCPL